jgi:hypothetical protein
MARQMKKLPAGSGFRLKSNTTKIQLRSVAVFCTNAVACECLRPVVGARPRSLETAQLKSSTQARGQETEGENMCKKKRKWARLGIRSLFLGLALGTPFLESQTASADSGPTTTGDVCMQQVYGGDTVTNSNRLNCTANDIKVAEAISAINQATGQASCTRGERFTLVATFRVDVTANERYDAAFFFNINGGTDARDVNGTCSESILRNPTQADPNSPVLNIDKDSCGDLNAGTYRNITFTIPDVLCQDTNNDRTLNLPNCTSWHSNGSTVCSGFSTAAPETKSKCNCDDTFQVPVTVETPGITVTKTATTGTTNGNGDPTLNEPAGNVTYSVSVKNDGNLVAITINSLTDDLYGNITQAAPTNPNITSTNCSLPQIIQPQGTYSCSFVAPVSGANGGDTITDEVCASGKDANQTDVGPTCDDATVVIVGVQPSATVEKKAIGAAVRFQVKVQNTSTFEELSLKKICDDKYGTIATSGELTCPAGTLGTIEDTTCGVSAADGGPGTLPVTLKVNGQVGDTYICDFDAAVPIDDGAKTDTVTATLSDNDVPPKSINPQGSATVTITTSHNP